MSVVKKKEKFNLHDILDLVSKDTKVSKTTANKVVSSFFSNITTIVKTNARAKVDGFGTFDSTVRHSKKKLKTKTIKFIPSVVCVKDLNLGENNGKHS